MCPPIDTFASVKPYELRCAFHARLRSIFRSMGSYLRREKAKQKARERADTVPVLDCQSCGALAPGDSHPQGRRARPRNRLQHRPNRVTSSLHRAYNRRSQSADGRVLVQYGGWF